MELSLGRKVILQDALRVETGLPFNVEIQVGKQQNPYCLWLARTCHIIIFGINLFCLSGYLKSYNLFLFSSLRCKTSQTTDVYFWQKQDDLLLECISISAFNPCCFSSWTGVCPEPGGFPLSTRTNYNGPYNPGDQVTYSCHEGTSFSVTCQSNGVWTPKNTCAGQLCKKICMCFWWPVRHYRNFFSFSSLPFLVKENESRKSAVNVENMPQKEDSCNTTMFIFSRHVRSTHDWFCNSTSTISCQNTSWNVTSSNKTNNCCLWGLHNSSAWCFQW